MRTIAALGLLLITCIALAASGEEQTARTKRIYESYCYVCHGTGWQGAPVAGIASEWQPRIEKGWDAVLKNTQAGLNGMPPKGTCEECGTADFRAVIELMMTEQ